jgi:hypothetical protein
VQLGDDVVEAPEQSHGNNTLMDVEQHLNGDSVQLEHQSVGMGTPLNQSMLSTILIQPLPCMQEGKCQGLPWW